MLADLHNHTAEGSDGIHLRRDLVAGAAQAGIGLLCITDHDFILASAEARALSAEFGILVVAGMERSVSFGHYLCFGISGFETERDAELKRQLLDEQERYRLSRPDINSGQLAFELGTLRETILRRFAGSVGRLDGAGGLPDDSVALIKAVQAAGGQVYWAHPFLGVTCLWYRLAAFLGHEPDFATDMTAFVDHIRRTDGPLWWCLNAIDGFECLSVHVAPNDLCNHLAVKLAQALNKPNVAGSDAHHPGAIATAAIEVPDTIRSEADWLTAMRDGAFRPVYLR